MANRDVGLPGISSGIVRLSGAQPTRQRRRDRARYRISDAFSEPSSQTVSSTKSGLTALKSERPNNAAPVDSGSRRCSTRLRRGSKRRPPSSSPNRGGMPARPRRQSASSICSRTQSSLAGMGIPLAAARMRACRNKIQSVHVIVRGLLKVHAIWLYLTISLGENDIPTASLPSFG